MLARRVDRVMLSFPGSESFFAKKAVTSLVGNPIRSEIVFADKEKARAELQLDDRPYIYPVGGSLGARRMNEGIIELIALHAPRQAWQHCHATGRFGWKWVPGKLQEAGVQVENCPALDLREYVYNAPTVMAAADVVISRAGAITLCELQALGKPAILIPSPNVTNNHQYHNAKALADRGAAILIEEKDLSGQRLFDEIRALLADPERLHSMQEKAREMAICDSAQRIYDIVTELVRSKRNG
jgi:UDP-N-acetylglucosamine--N-acetylmuramyl-(pentapeptide) pyrophosphoryl-undecaprenol N-acetylglucosamine transferase